MVTIGLLGSGLSETSPLLQQVELSLIGHRISTSLSIKRDCTLESAGTFLLAEEVLQLIGASEAPLLQRRDLRSQSASMVSKPLFSLARECFFFGGCGSNDFIQVSRIVLEASIFWAS